MRRMRPCDYRDGYDEDEPEIEVRDPPIMYDLAHCEDYPRIWIPLADVAKACLRLIQTAMELRPQCESPIEVQLGANLLHILRGSRFRLVPQYEWRGFRNDFAIVHEGRVVMFIECDGKEFHSTTEQIARDRRKDAAAKADGIPLLRFTGSEIFHNAQWIAKIVCKQLESAVQ